MGIRDSYIKRIKWDRVIGNKSLTAVINHSVNWSYFYHRKVVYFQIYSSVMLYMVTPSDQSESRIGHKIKYFIRDGIVAIQKTQGIKTCLVVSTYPEKKCTVLILRVSIKAELNYFLLHCARELKATPQ